MIPLPGLDLPNLRIPYSANLKPIRHALEVSQQAPSHFPPQCASLPRFILGKRPRDVGKRLT